MTTQGKLNEIAQQFTSLKNDKDNIFLPEKFKLGNFEDNELFRNLQEYQLNN